MRSPSLRWRKIVGTSAILAGMLIGFVGVMAVAQTPGSPDQIPDAQIQAPAQALIGAPVLSADGTEVGMVSAVTVAADGHISEVRFTTSALLGLGERTVTVRQDSFLALDGAVVLDMSAEEIGALPTQIVLRGTSA